MARQRPTLFLETNDWDTHTAPRRWLAVIPVIALVVAAAAMWQLNRPEPIGAASTLPVCDSDHPHLTVVVLDVSPSVISADGADPDGRSFDEARELARLLAADPCTPDDRFAAIVFGAEAILQMPPTLLSQSSDIAAGLRNQGYANLGDSTDISASIRTVDSIASDHPHHELSAIWLSDMMGDPFTEQHLRTLAAEHAYLVALGDYDPYFNQYFDAVHEIVTVKPGAVAHALTESISRTRGAP
ncbi:MAG: VWA domain-containing protein [bacterium]|nr:VWA domain-containing protein [bacterium]